jgi:hypothetical protein
VKPWTRRRPARIPRPSATRYASRAHADARNCTAHARGTAEDHLAPRGTPGHSLSNARARGKAHTPNRAHANLRMHRRTASAPSARAPPHQCTPLHPEPCPHTQPVIAPRELQGLLREPELRTNYARITPELRTNYARTTPELRPNFARTTPKSPTMRAKLCEPSNLCPYEPSREPGCVTRSCGCPHPSRLPDRARARSSACSLAYRSHSSRS